MRATSRLLILLTKNIPPLQFQLNPYITILFQRYHVERCTLYLQPRWAIISNFRFLIKLQFLIVTLLAKCANIHIADTNNSASRNLVYYDFRLCATQLYYIYSSCYTCRIPITHMLPILLWC